MIRLPALAAEAVRRRMLAPLLLAALYLAAAMLPLAVAEIAGKAGLPIWRDIGAGLGLVAAALLFLQFLSSGRFEGLTGGIGIDASMGFHRMAALALLLAALAHPMAYVGKELLFDPAAALGRLSAMAASPWLRSGVIALIGLVVLVSFASVRTRAVIRYEIWRGTHGVLALLVAALTLNHAMKVGTYAAEPAVRLTLVALALVAVMALATVLILRPLRMWREQWQVEGVKPLGEGIVELAIRGPQSTGLRFRGGQFIWLSIAPFGPPFHDHPFSIASGLHELPRVRFIVRKAGDCTSGFEGVEPGRRVAIDGPHGSFVLPATTGPVILVAGGVGIAPVLGVLEEAAEKGDRRPFHLLYAARHASALAGLDRLDDLGRTLDLHRTLCLDSGACEAGDVPGPITRNTLETLFSGVEPATVTVMLCGPSAMMELVGDALIEMGVPADAVHYERFDYAAGKGRLDKRRRNYALAVLSVPFLAIMAFALR